MASFDYKKTEKLLEDINQIIYSNKELDNFFNYKDYSLMHGLQSHIFSIAKKYTKDGLDIEKTSIRVFIQKYLWSVFFIFLFKLNILFLIFRKNNILVFSTDVLSNNTKYDKRIESLYKFLEKENIKYTEIIRTVPSLNTFKNFFKRGRLVFYLETFDFWINIYISIFHSSKIKKIVDNIEFENSSDSEFIKLTTKKLIEYSILTKIRLKIFYSIFRFIKLRKIIGIDDARNFNELSIIADMLNIDFIVIQHGHYTKYHVGFLKKYNSDKKSALPSKLIVWSDYWKNELLRLNSVLKSNQIYVGRPLGINSQIYFDNKKDIARNVILTFETDAPFDEVCKYIKRIKEKSNLNLFIKIRADQPLDSQLSLYSCANFLKPIKDLKDFSNSNSCILGTYSTFLYDSIALGFPVGLLDTSNDYGEGMVKNGVAKSIFYNDLLEDQIVDLINTNEIDKREIFNKVTKSDYDIFKWFKEFLC